MRSLELEPAFENPEEQRNLESDQRADHENDGIEEDAKRTDVRKQDEERGRGRTAERAQSGTRLE